MDRSQRDAIVAKFWNVMAWGLMGIGLAVTCLTFVVPAVRLLLAYRWTATPCAVVSSSFHQEMTSVQVRRGGGSGQMHSENRPEYIPDITFAYTVGGHAYQSARYDFSSAHGFMNADDARAVVRRHPAGAHVTCYVSPGDPAQAVLARGADRSLAFGLLPMVFFALGLFIKVRSPRVFPQS